MDCGQTHLRLPPEQQKDFLPPSPPPSVIQHVGGEGGATQLPAKPSVTRVTRWVRLNQSWFDNDQELQGLVRPISSFNHLLLIASNYRNVRVLVYPSSLTHGDNCISQERTLCVVFIYIYMCVYSSLQGSLATMISRGPRRCLAKNLELTGN